MRYDTGPNEPFLTQETGPEAMGRPIPGPSRPSRRPDGGFTLIELMTVIMIIGILVAIGLPNYKVSIIRAKETVLLENLTRLRSLLDQYNADRGVYPASLERLVEDGYLRKIPIDPMTNSADWHEEPEKSDPSNPGSTPGIYDVKSSAAGTSLSGTPYSEW